MNLNLNQFFDQEVPLENGVPLENEVPNFDNEIFDLLNINPAQVRPNQQRCGHCGQLGHIQTHCRRAQSDGHNLHLRIINAMQFRQQNNSPEHIRLILNNMTVRQLKLLMNTLGINRHSEFVIMLENYGTIPPGTSNLQYKQDRVIVMLWYYLNESSFVVSNRNVSDMGNTFMGRLERLILRKLDITTKIIVDSESFDCPICLNPNESKEKLISNCNHAVCKNCLSNYFNHLINNYVTKKPCCSLCRTDLTCITFTNQEYQKEVSEKYFVTI